MAGPVETKAGRPTLHHLNVQYSLSYPPQDATNLLQNSQSLRVLWLLEELGIEYNLVLYKRDKGHRAPPEMENVQELGKAPMLVTSDGLVIIESSAVIAYLIKTYDTDGKFTTEDWIRDETLTSFAGATLGGLISVEMLFDVAAKHTPWPLVYLSRALQKGIRNNFTNKEFRKDLGYLEKELGGEEWFNGKSFGRSDVMLSWPMDMIAQRGWVDFKKQYPRIGAWRERIESRSAWKSALEKGGSYNLAF
jgi:glutathione S-transferase